ncbi:terpene synthase family protein [Streptomyces sp. LaBMicrA B280]|uniref:terpene synthase family protein n=1 Tax=Streptomyces sp. LaBMicrA B280 TaxID=3391001 RepID=UPI003BA72398
MGRAEWDQIWPSDTSRRLLPYLRNVHDEEIQESLRSWLHESGMLAAHPQTVDRHVQDFAAYTSYSYPGAPRDGLLLAAKWMTFFFLFDNELDDQPVASIPAETRSLLCDLDKIVSLGTKTQPEPDTWNSPYAQVLDHLWKEAREFYCNPAWERLFVNLFARYQRAQRWELYSKSLGRQWDFTTYTEWKRHGTAGLLGGSFVALFTRRPLPDELLQGHVLRRMSDMACDVLHLATDINSAAREARFEGVPSVLTTLLHNGADITRDEAFRIFLTHLWQPRLNSLLQAAQDLPHLLDAMGQNTPQNLSDAENFTEDLLLWTGGHLQWLTYAARYHHESETT